VPVMDVLMRFGMPPGKDTRRTCIVIVECIENADAGNSASWSTRWIHSVLDIPTAEIEPSPRLGTHLSAGFIQCMGKIAGRFPILLEMRCLLEDQTDAIGYAEMPNGNRNNQC